MLCCVYAPRMKGLGSGTYIVRMSVQVYVACNTTIFTFDKVITKRHVVFRLGDCDVTILCTGHLLSMHLKNCGLSKKSFTYSHTVPKCVTTHSNPNVVVNDCGFLSWGDQCRLTCAFGFEADPLVNDPIVTCAYNTSDPGIGQLVTMNATSQFDCKGISRTCTLMRRDLWCMLKYAWTILAAA